MTIFNLPVAAIEHKDTILEDDFINNMGGWELIEHEDEKSFISDSHYYLENKTSTRWMFYHKALANGFPKNFILNAEMELLDHQGYGQFGLIWGFTKPHHILNRFVVSAEADRFTVSRFEKDHHKVFHRFSGSYEPLDMKTRKYFLSVMLLDDYYYFFVRQFGRPVYICHKSHLHSEGDRFGFYVEPGLMIRIDNVKIRRLITRPDFDGNAWMPMGSEMVNGR
jgi:hypothetical protein